MRRCCVGGTYRWTPNESGLSVDFGPPTGSTTNLAGFTCFMTLNGPLDVPYTTPVTSGPFAMADLGTNPALGLFFRNGATADLPLPGTWEIEFTLSGPGGVVLPIPPIRFEVSELADSA